MELDQEVRPNHDHSKGKLAGDSALHVNLYKNPPNDHLTKEDCEDLFRQRLEAYAIIENSDLTDKKWGDVTNALRNIKSFVYKTNCIILKLNNEQQLRLDHWSHMLTRLYCIYQPTLWGWFKKCESKLFRFKIKDLGGSLSAAQMELILMSFGFKFERVKDVDLYEVRADKTIGWDRPDSGEIFKVKFTNALQYVAKRRVGLKNGYAYLSKLDLISIACDAFEEHLEAELSYARQRVDFQDPQVHQLIESMDLLYRDYHEKIEEERRSAARDRAGNRKNAHAIDLEDLDQIVKDHYPPCMRYIQEALSQDNHLRHQSRLYYTAFLRAGGVEMDDTVELFRKEFTKKIANDKFERDYKYNIRHIYGKEGHKKALSCFRCDRIINDNPPAMGDKHGCPFKHFDEAHLRPMLSRHGLKEVDIDSVMIHTNEKEYTTACSRYFEARRGCKPSDKIYSPINYFYESKVAANRPVPMEGDEEEQPLAQPTESNTNQNINKDNIEEGTDIAWED